MVDILGQTTDLVGGSLGGFTQFIIWIAILVLIALASGFTIYIVYRARIYNKKVNIFEYIGNDYEPTKKARARTIKLNETGDTYFYIPKFKKPLPLPSRQTGRNTFWFVIDKDTHEWVNVGVSDFDKLKSELRLDCPPIAMTYARVKLHGTLRDNFKKYTAAPMVIAFVGSLIFLLILGVLVYLNWDKMQEVMGGVAESQKQQVELSKQNTELIKEIKGVVAHIENIEGGSGIIPAKT